MQALPNPLLWKKPPSFLTVSELMVAGSAIGARQYNQQQPETHLIRIDRDVETADTNNNFNWGLLLAAITDKPHQISSLGTALMLMALALPL